MEFAAHGRAILERRIENAERREVVEHRTGAADVLCVAVREQEGIEPVHAPGAQIGKRGISVTSSRPAIDEPVASGGMQMNRAAFAKVENREFAIGPSRWFRQ